MSKGQSQTRFQSGRKAFGKYKSKTIEIIDIEKGKTNVAIIDALESSYQDYDYPKAKTNEIPSVVIHIDDEEGEIDKLQSNADQLSSNSRVCPVFDNHSAPQELDDEERVMYSKEDLSSSSYSTEKRSPRFVSSRSPHAIYYSCSRRHSSESDSSTFSTSGSDDSDLEVEDISGNLHVQWERAALRKKMSQTVRMKSDDQFSVSGSSVDPCCSSSEPTQNMVDLDDCRIKSYFEHSNVPCKNRSFSEHFKHTQNVDHLEDCTDKHYHYFEASPSTCGPSHSCCEASFWKNKSVSESGRLRSQILETHIDLNQTVTPVSVSGHLRSQIFENHIDLSETFTPNLQMDGNTTISIDAFCCMEKAEKAPSGNCSSTSTIRVETNFEDEEEPSAGKPFNSMDPWHPKADSSCNHSEKEFGLSTELQHDSPVHLEINPGAKEKSFAEQTPAFNDPLHDEPINKYSTELFDCETQVIHGESTSINDAENEASGCNLSLSVGMQDLSFSIDNLTNAPEKHNKIMITPTVSEVQSTTAAISDWEKHKESDEYKRAAEEEWTQRKREIQSQAEEAQRLRKRRRAESSRLLDMEKRQKQRVEEIRESQRKDEQMVHLKEELRAEVRKELDEMEWTHRDMASLLRGLDIHVEGGPSPMLREVHAAYKQALRRFHPDRVSRTDIRKQVEAEEIFKMISRLKEKLLPAL